MKNTIKLKTIPLLAGFLALTNTFTMAAQDWPQWRGPNRDGWSPDTGLLKQWPEGGPKPLWKTTGLGGGYSMPSITGGRIYGMSYRGDDEVVWALDAENGKELWCSRLDSASLKIGYPEGSRCTPTVAGDSLYVIGAGGMLACLDKNSGKVAWQKALIKDFGGKMMSGWGYAQSPLVDGQRVICIPGGAQGTVMAFDKQSGEAMWRCADLKDNASYSSAIKASIGGQEQYIVLTDASVAGIAAKDGKLLWRAERRGKTAVIPTPIFFENQVYVTSGYDIGCNLFKITASQDAFQVEQVYANKNMVNHHGGVVKVGPYLYGFSDRNGWICQDFLTGDIKWQNKGVGKGSISYADGFLYMRSESKGTVVLVPASPEKYQETGRFDQPDRSDKNSWPHPVIVGGRLYLRDQDLLLCYDVNAK